MRLAADQKTLCSFCTRNLPFTFYKPTANPLFAKLNVQQPIASVFALCYYNQGNVVRQLMKELKYRSNQSVGQFFGRLLAEKLMHFNLKYDVITPIPLHKKRLKKRGYNQSAIIAQTLAEHLQVAYCSDVLIRVKENRSQTTKHQMDRFTNVSDLFKLNQVSLVQGKSICLIDDVLTTGATILEAAQTLHTANIEALHLVLVARSGEL